MPLELPACLARETLGGEGESNALFPLFDDRLRGRDGRCVDNARKGRAAHRELHAGSVLRGRRSLDKGRQDLGRRLLVARQVPTEARQRLERQRRVGVGNLKSETSPRGQLVQRHASGTLWAGSDLLAVGLGGGLDTALGQRVVVLEERRQDVPQRPNIDQLREATQATKPASERASNKANDPPNGCVRLRTQSSNGSESP